MQGERLMLVRSISLELVLRVAAVSLLGAEVWIHLIQEPPYSAFLWDPLYFEWAVKIITGGEWRDYLMGPGGDSAVRICTKTMTVLLALGFGAAIFINKSRFWLRWPLYLSSAILLFISFCKFLSVGYQVPMLLEHTLRIITPVLLVWMVRDGFSRTLYLGMMIATALTFMSHGFYALGLGVSVPGHFIDMTMETLGFSESGARVYLQVAGLLDQLMVIGFLIPILRQWALLYGTFWGFITSLARLTSYVRFDVLLGMTMIAYLPQFFVRAPHFLVPLILWSYVKQKRHLSPDQEKDAVLS